MPNLITLPSGSPALAPDAWLAPGSTVVGAVTLGSQVGVWYGAVLRADLDTVVVGDRSNVQDGAVVHADPGFPVRVGSGVSVGHRAVLHGCTVEDDVLIGMGAVVMNGARIGAGSLVAAGALVLEGTEVPPRSLVAGVPGKVRRELDEAGAQAVRDNAEDYCRLAREHARGTTWTRGD